MNKLLCAIVSACCSHFMFAQNVLQDEALQARVHYMNAAKVSYITSADVFEVYEDPNQEPEIPDEIKESFRNKYQGAKKVEWIIKEDRYKVNFLFNGNEMFTYLNRHGHWMKSFTRLDLEDLPQKVISYLEAEYPDYQLTKHYLKDTPDEKTYTVAVKGNGEYVWLEFNQDGQLLNNPT